MILLYIEEEKRHVNIYTERAKNYTLPMRCNDYLNRLCEFYGSSLIGRKQAACAFLHIRQKAPIYIREGILLFQSIAAASSQHIWINYWRLKRLVKECYQTRFVFTDHSELLTDMEYRSAIMQMRRCLHYSYLLTIRMNQLSIENSAGEDYSTMNQRIKNNDDILFA